jgi:uncharacterized protein YecE (DUF72 family)
MSPFVGTAGWSIAKQHADAFEAGGSMLERYATRLNAVEVNSSFHRPHRRTTWERWAAVAPAHFRFSAKLPKVVTHERRLVDATEPLAQFLDEVGGLGDKLAVLIAQLPPSLAFDATIARAFFTDLGARTPAALACEPRHASWFEPDAEALMMGLKVARIAADPAPVPAAANPAGGWPALAYWRLHGSPAMYRTPYDDARLDAYAAQIRVARARGAEVWCMFDNTMSSAATANALTLAEKLA